MQFSISAKIEKLLWNQNFAVSPKKLIPVCGGLKSSKRESQNQRISTLFNDGFSSFRRPSYFPDGELHTFPVWDLLSDVFIHHHFTVHAKQKSNQHKTQRNAVISFLPFSNDQQIACLHLWVLMKARWLCRQSDMQIIVRLLNVLLFRKSKLWDSLESHLENHIPFKTRS